MDRRKFYKTVVWVLVALNVLILFAFLVVVPRLHGPPSGAEGKALRHRIPNMLALDPTQNTTFQSLADQHRAKINELHDDQSATLQAYFQSLIRDQLPTDSLLTRLEVLEREKIALTYAHFQDIKAILRPEQRENYGRFVEEATRIVLSR